MSFSGFNLISTVLSHSGTRESREACEPPFVYGCNPCGDRRCTKGHVIEVDECWYGPDSEAVSSVYCGVSWIPPVKFSRVGSMNVDHIKFTCLVAMSFQYSFPGDGEVRFVRFEDGSLGALEEDC